MHAVDRPASPIFFLPDQPLVASQHTITGQTTGSVASACWRLIMLLEYLDEARKKAVSHLLQSPRLLEGAHSHQKLASAAKVIEQQAKY